MRYDFEFSWDSTYGYAARLVGEHADRGLVIDLGAGLGTFSQPLGELGFDYLGFEYDAESVEECRHRGLECEQIDLRDMDDVRRRVLAAAGARRVVAVSMLDVVEHLPEPEAVLAGVAAVLDALATDGRPPLLVLSIPNVSHADLSAKLALGRWDVTDVGLLDSTHITLFTHERLAGVLAGAGFVEVGRNDVVFSETEQRFPPDHPAVADTPVSTLLRTLRLRADSFGRTYQFVRCYRRGMPPAASDAHQTRCTVVVATTVDDRLSETLASLGSQTEPDIDVRVVIPAPCVERFQTHVDALPEAIRERVHIHAVDSDRPADLLNAGLEHAAGRFVTFARSGTVVDPDAISQLCDCAEAHPGHVVRRRSGGATPFDLLQHLIVDDTPLEAIAIPSTALDALGLRFVDVGDGFEGWDFIWHAASALGVVDCPTETPSDRARGAAGGMVPPDLPASMDREQLVLPSGSAPVVRRALVALDERHQLESQLVIAHQRIDAIERSRYWRITGPLRRVTSKRPSLRPWRRTPRAH